MIAAATAREALDAAADALRAAGVETARLDAELLLAKATGRDRAHLVAAPEADVEASAARRFGEMVRRRVAREPVAYILGRRGFRHIEVAVDGRALIPRPETELLVELAVELRPRSVLDVGTGSGAVALAVADELADASVRGVDTSGDAISLARSNAERLGLADRVNFDVVASSFSMSVTSRQWDLVVANLPYVRDDEWRTLPPDIRDHEPREALVAGPTGLEVIERILSGLALADEPVPAVALEVGAGQAGAVAELVRRTGYDEVETRRDLAGIDRVVVGRR